MKKIVWCLMTIISIVIIVLSSLNLNKKPEYDKYPIYEPSMVLSFPYYEHIPKYDYENMNINIILIIGIEMINIIGFTIVFIKTRKYAILYGIILFLICNMSIFFIPIEKETYVTVTNMYKKSYSYADREFVEENTKIIYSNIFGYELKTIKIERK